jgi:hypothetical protein
LAWRMIGRAMQHRLTSIGTVLTDPKMVRRYAPVWHQDILVAVQRKPKRLVELLAREAAVVNSVIDLGTMRDERSGKRFSRFLAAASRSFDVDATALREKLLGEATQVLESQDHGECMDS